MFIVLFLNLFSGCSGDNPPAQPEKTTGDVSYRSFYSAALGRNWDYAVYLPKSYANNTTEMYEVLYLLHGHGGSRTDWITQGAVQAKLDSLTAAGTIREIIVVMPSGGNSWWVDGTELMESAVITNLIPEIESLYRVKPGRESRSIGGNSAGGYGALRFALKFPAMFTNAVLMSPAAYFPQPDPDSSARTGVPSFQTNGVFSEALWTAYNYPSYWTAFDALPSAMHNFFISVGTADQFEGICLAVTNQLPDAFSTRTGSAAVDVKSYAGGHEWSVWRQAFEYAVREMYGK